MSNGTNEATWVDLKAGAKVLRLWETSNAPDIPEVAILWLSDARYKEFTKDPRQFLIDNNIFYRKDLNKIIAGPPLTPESDKASGKDWMVTVEHDWSACNSGVMAMRLFAPKPDKSY